MKVLIIFATIEGQTGKIVRFLADEIRAAGHEVELVDAADKTVPVSFDGVDKVILAASVHERRHPKPFEVFLAAQQEQLEALETLLISVSLMAAFPDTLDEAQEFVTEMKMRTGFTPGSEALVAGAVRTGSYDYFASQVLRHVVLKGHEYDLGQGDHEFTEWEGLKGTLSEFMGVPVS
ncbi:flavodoxin domain-containing protein [uncultured Roseovarius sp.]|uniref:flavodoxin domain-containing protein n=1 Tax=uncultured Roseovarius sp. TaxID=293344 RepID=UPI002631AE55|nr:flavodoxin domain-containing protein [uncultured Roseovarius sp.]